MAFHGRISAKAESPGYCASFQSAQSPPPFAGFGSHAAIVGNARWTGYLALPIDSAISKVQSPLEQVHQDAKKLVVLTDAQLAQPATLSLLDDMVKHAQDAFVGQFDPTTGEIQNGVTQIHYAIQRLATMEVTVIPASFARTNHSNSSSMELCIPCLLNNVQQQT